MTQLRPDNGASRDFAHLADSARMNAANVKQDALSASLKNATVANARHGTFGKEPA
jgi:hypothetical protein